MSLVETIPVLRRGQMAAVDTQPCEHAQDFGAVPSAGPADDLARNVYCVLGMPIDAIDMATVLRRIEAAAISRAPFLISTLNLNFLVNSRSDPQFRESLLDSDLCSADGMPIVWIARLIGLPIKERVSGSDIFEALKAPDRCARRLRVFLFGGAPGVAAAAASTLNGMPGGLSCVESVDPGFGTVEEMSRNDILATINASEADFLAVSLGAKKGQLWLLRNHERLRIPVRAHLGAVMNFQAGSVKRAPPSVRACGLEWLWRIKEEPYLWRRYWNDGCVLLRLLLTRVLPLATATLWHRLVPREQDLLIETTQNSESAMIRLCGVATEPHIQKAISCFRDALIASRQCIIIDLSDTRVMDPRFLGLLLMLRKQVKKQQASLKFVRMSRQAERMFRLNGVGFLLASERSV